RLEHALHPADHELDGPGGPAARARLPGVDVLGLPQAHHPHLDRGGTGARMRPVDPRLLRYAPAARRYLLGSALIAVAQTGVTVAFSWLLAGEITAVVEGGGVDAARLGALAAVVVLRGILLWVSEARGLRAAAGAGAELRQALIAAIGRRGPAWLAQRNRAALAVTAGHGLDA